MNRPDYGRPRKHVNATSLRNTRELRAALRPELSGGDSLEALQLALGMMVVQVESYQRDCGLTLMGDEQLGLMKPDFEAIKKEIAASPHYEQARAVLDEWDCARAFLQDGSPGSRLD